MRVRGFVYTYIQLSVGRSQILTAVFLRIQSLTDMWPCVAKSAASSPGKYHTVHGDCLPAYDAGTRLFLNVWRHQKHSVTSQNTQSTKQAFADNQPRECESHQTFRRRFLPPSSGGWGCKGTVCLCVFKKRQMTWRWRMNSSEIWHGVYSWIIIDILDYPEYGDNKIFRNVCTDLANDTKSYPRRP